MIDGYCYGVVAGRASGGEATRGGQIERKTSGQGSTQVDSFCHISIRYHILPIVRLRDRKWHRERETGTKRDVGNRCVYCKASHRKGGIRYCKTYMQRMIKRNKEENKVCFGAQCLFKSIRLLQRYRGERRVLAERSKQR